MQLRVGPCLIELVQGDITRQHADAIVNAANAHLAGGGGVDGAIHRSAGPAVMEETRRRYPDGCPTGSAVPSGAGALQATYLFHAVGPVWRGGIQGERPLLRSAYERCLELARDHACSSLAFPAISTGAYGYPMDLAAEDALSVVRDALHAHGRPSLVRFVLFDAGAFGAFARVLEAMAD